MNAPGVRSKRRVSRQHAREALGSFANCPMDPEHPRRGRRLLLAFHLLCGVSASPTEARLEVNVSLTLGRVVAAPFAHKVTLLAYVLPLPFFFLKLLLFKILSVAHHCMVLRFENGHKFPR